MPAGQPPDPAAEGQPANAGVGDVPGRAGQPVRLGLAVQLPEQCAAGRRGHPPVGVDLDPGHRREVDHQAVVAGREPGVAVAAAAHGDQQVVVAGDTDGRDHVLDTGAAGHGRRAGVGGGVPDRPGPLVRMVAGQHNLAPEPLTQPSEGQVRPAVRHPPTVAGQRSAAVALAWRVSGWPR